MCASFAISQSMNITATVCEQCSGKTGQALNVFNSEKK